jgi:hypothetical protein
MVEWRIMPMAKRPRARTVSDVADRIQDEAALPYTGIPYDLGHQISELTVLISKDLIQNTNKRVGFDLHNSGSWHKSWYETCDLFVGIADMLWEE